jgi:hypothetical protein
MDGGDTWVDVMYLSCPPGRANLVGPSLPQGPQKAGVHAAADHQDAALHCWWRFKTPRFNNGTTNSPSAATAVVANGNSLDLLMLPTRRRTAYDTGGHALFQAVANRGETDKCLYLRLKSAGVWRSMVLGETVGVV